MRARKGLAALSAAMVVGAVAPAAADQSASTDVLFAAIAGSRTLHVTTAAGADLDGGALDLGTAHTGGFVVSVEDVAYDHVGYNVSGTLSDAALVTGPGTVDCGTRIDSAKFTVGFPIDPQLLDLAAIINGSVDLEGTVGAALVALLDPTGAIDTILGGAGLDLLENRPLSTTVDAIGAQLEDAIAGAKKVLDGADALLPVKVGNGDPGAFTNAAEHPKCVGSADPSPTSQLLMSGDATDLGGFVDGLITDLTALVDGVTASTMIGDGTIDAAAAEAAANQAIQDLEDTINAELAALPTPLPPIALPQTADVVNEVLRVLTGTLGAVVDLIGQTGVGIVAPDLDVDADDAPASGVFEARLVVTLVDRPPAA